MPVCLCSFREMGGTYRRGHVHRPDSLVHMAINNRQGQTSKVVLWHLHTYCGTHIPWSHKQNTHHLYTHMPWNATKLAICMGDKISNAIKLSMCVRDSLPSHAGAGRTHETKAGHDIRAPVLSSPLRKQSDQKPFLSLFAGVVSLTGAFVSKGAQKMFGKVCGDLGVFLTCPHSWPNSKLWPWVDSSPTMVRERSGVCLRAEGLQTRRVSLKIHFM